MLNLAASERRAVLNLDAAAFDQACSELLDLASRDQRPDALIAIPTGGLVVGRSMAKVAGGHLPILSLTCRRPSSKLKPGGSVVRRMVSGLPRPVVDRLRLAEHAILTRRAAPSPAAPYRFVDDEVDVLVRWMAAAPRPPRLLIVDDAVDSGATLSQVMDAVQRHAPSGARIQSAAITVTTDRPLIRPDFTLFNRQLCRFPWSLDAR
jgi:hypoxanthine phosphoribosyltransferase